MKSEQIRKYDKYSVAQLRKKAKVYFNKFIRLRDTDENGFGRCISSGRPLKYGTKNAQAGHYYSGGKYPALEFDEDNVHLQGLSDNYFNGANLLNYRKNLIKKIGVERLETLELKAEASKRTPFKYDRFRLIEIIEDYKVKCKELLKTKNF